MVLSQRALLWSEAAWGQPRRCLGQRIAWLSEVWVFQGRRVTPGGAPPSTCEWTLGRPAEAASLLEPGWMWTQVDGEASPRDRAPRRGRMDPCAHQAGHARGGVSFANDFSRCGLSGGC